MNTPPMDTYLTTLIERINDKSDHGTGTENFRSDATISWKALREAERLANPEYIPPLIQFIETENNKDRRRAAYFVLAKIAKNTADAAATQYLTSRVPHETNEDILGSLLDRLSELPKPAGTDIQPLIEATNHKGWFVRHSAIGSLKHTKDKRAENCLLHILQHTTDPSDLVYANATLSYIGTPKAIPALTKLITHPTMDVAGSALNAIVRISDSTSLPLFLEQLDKGKLKPIALEGVAKHGGEESIPAIIKRIKELVARPRKRQVIVAPNRETEIIMGMKFLRPHARAHDEIRKLYELLTTKKRALLWDQEKTWLAKEQPNFSP